ncbi:MAG: lytic transglycosylase domain-containing protein [Synergistaceae bacterium]|nr:lytic transglycosylase domain-containing protein [Synergistaceae bacterium]
MGRKILCTLIIVLAIVNFSEAATQNPKVKNIVELFTRVNPKLSAKTAQNYADIILQAGEKFKIEPYVIAAMIVHESTVNNKAVSKGGDYGLMQIRYKVHSKAIKQRFPKVKRASDMFDARINIFFGCEIFSECYAKTKNVYDALKRYSAGNKKLADKVTATVRELQAKDNKNSKNKNNKTNKSDNKNVNTKTRKGK